MEWKYCGAYTHLETHHDKNLRCGQGGRDLKSSSTKQSKGCVVSFNTISKEHIKRVIHVRGKTETHARIRDAITSIPSKRSLMTARWKKTKGTSIALGNRERYVGRGNFMRNPAISSTNKTCFKPGDLGAPEERKLRRERKNLKESPLPIQQHGQCRRHNFVCLWSEATKLVARTREACWHFAPRRFRSHPSSHKARDTTSKSER